MSSCCRFYAKMNFKPASRRASYHTDMKVSTVRRRPGVPPTSESNPKRLRAEADRRLDVFSFAHRARTPRGARRTPSGTLCLRLLRALTYASPIGRATAELPVVEHYYESKADDVVGGSEQRRGCARRAPGSHLRFPRRTQAATIRHMRRNTL
ncbi:hypothetical protein PYCCODRAFT_841371 [Trametes coccinea BRFM310]|uniref:Uncharacterized protein n=1 Tax=Trametes coccinea (strain BRFM310) TaxID=1353009 RepID=A0A1Y2IE74_TRAC3|nr:hypothetical protein PYCCODRAFT_841371 [Trametes coccinea BRFM310]